jgi:tRNA (guanine-N7-)-methyltransferase
LNEQDRDAGVPRRAIRSFVKRTGRLTAGQQSALQNLWPRYGIEFDHSTRLDLATLFPTKKCFKLEIGFGNGDSLVKMASDDPDCGYIGIEVHEPGVGHCLNGLHDAGLDNLRLMTRDAIDVLQYMMPENSLDRVFLFFPDPWHKKRHHKRRIVNQQFRDLIHAALKADGVLHMATDWQDYAEHMVEEMSHDLRFTNLGNAQGFSERPAYRPLTKFERRGQKLGHGVWDLLFRKQ